MQTTVLDCGVLPKCTVEQHSAEVWDNFPGRPAENLIDSLRRKAMTVARYSLRGIAVLAAIAAAFDASCRAAGSPTSELVNLSGRAFVGNSEAVLVGGFVIAGSEPLTVAVRAIGKGLTRFGVTSPAADVKIEMYAGDRVIATNDDWKTAINRTAIEAAGLSPPDDTDAVVWVTLAAGAYTAVVQDKGSGGVCTLEVFNVDGGSKSRLVNVSVRSWVGVSENAAIAGFVINKPSTIVIRTLGPSLRQFGVREPVAGTTIRVHRQVDGLVVYENDGWETVGNQRLRGDLTYFQPFDPAEAAGVMTLPVGAYSVVVEAKGGTPGVGLTEVYRIDTAERETDWQLATQQAAFSARDSTAHVVFQNKLWLLGGWTPVRANEVWFSDDGFVWTKVAEGAPWKSRNLASAVVHQNRILLLAGAATDGNEMLGDVWSSSDGKNWSILTERADWPARAAATAVVYNDRVWLMGGQTNAKRDESNVHFADVWTTTDGAKWSQVTGRAAWGPRSMHGSVVFNNRIWVIGGGLYSDFTTNYADAWSSMDGFQWTRETATAPWPNRRFHKTVVFDNAIWLVGGVHYGAGPPYNRSDVWSSRDGINWVELASRSPWESRHEMALFAFKNKLWVVGGGGENDAVFNDVWIFDPSVSAPQSAGIRYRD